MDLDIAIREHADYKIKLILYLNESCCLDEKRLTNSSSCSLGIWLQQCQRQYRHFSEFSNVVTVHKKFHRKVGEVFKLAKEGKRYQAKEALKMNGMLTDITVELSQKLLLLKRRFSKAS